MNKNSFFLWVIVCLVITNVVALVLFFSNKPSRRFHDKPRTIIIERLEFEPQQIKVYDQLINVHRQRIHQLDAQLRKTKGELFGTLGSGYDPQIKDSLLNQLNRLQHEIEEKHLQHFLDIKNLCYEGQLGAFDSLTKDLAFIFRPGPPH